MTELTVIVVSNVWTRNALSDKKRTIACSWCLSYGTVRSYLLGLICKLFSLTKTNGLRGRSGNDWIDNNRGLSISRLDIKLSWKYSMFTERSCSVHNFMGKWSRHDGPPFQQIESELSSEKKKLYIIKSNNRTYHRCKSCIGSVP